MTDVSPPVHDSEQEHEHERALETPASGEVDLRYPQILLQASFASLLSSSFPSTAETQLATMPMSEHSLSESWTSLSEADYGPDEDTRSQTTGVVSLLDTTASEDSHSEAEHEDASETDDDEDEEDQAAANTQEPAEPSTPIRTSVAQLRDAQPYDSTSTIGAPSPNAIKFLEADLWPMTGRVDLMHSVKVFDEKERADLVRYIPKVHRAAQLNGTIRMTTSRGSLRRDRPFRLLYSGSPLAAETRAEILKKIGDVLVASSDLNIRHDMNASRYHVIPSEFGPGSSPNYAELIPLQFQQMIVDECIAAEAFKQESTHSQIQLKYKGGHSILSLWDGATYRVPKGSGWDPPDLAVIFVREGDGTERQLFSGRLNEFTSRHHIPTLVIRDDNDWSSSYDYIIPDRRSLHMCVESRATGILQILPIDLSSFINLDASQLNKHIACLCEIYDQDAERKKIALKLRQAPSSREIAGDVEKNLSKSIVAQNRTKAFLVKHENAINKAWQFSVGILLLILGLSICKELVVALAAFFGGVSSLTGFAPSTTHSIQPTVSMVTTTAIIPTSVASVSTISIQNKVSSVALTAPNLDKELARLVSDAAAVHNESDNFQVQILGDCHVIVKAPQRLLGKKKPPKVVISVTRGSAEVPSNTSKLFEGLYTVKIDREHANGLLNVTIVVKKPFITETCELEFGQPWMPADKLKEAIKHFWLPIRDHADLFEQDPRITLGNVLATAQDNLQALSTFGVSLVSNITQYGPSVRNLSYTTQSKSQDLYTNTVHRAKVVTQAFGRQTHAELQQLGQMSHVASQRASTLARDLFAGLSARIVSIRDAAGHLDLEDIRDKLVRSETMAEAQERARKLSNDVSHKVKAHREKVKAKKAERRKTRAERKMKKREGRKAWHDNVRVNFPALNLGF
jgi:hypothetical protein